MEGYKFEVEDDLQHQYTICSTRDGMTMTKSESPTYEVLCVEDEQVRKNASVMILYGVISTGKTMALQRFSEAKGDVLQLLTPSGLGKPLDVSCADWDGFAGVIVDEVLMWDRASAQAGILQLEQEAVNRNKKLILVAQMQHDLTRASIVLNTTPTIFQWLGKDSVLPLSLEHGLLMFV